MLRPPKMIAEKHLVDSEGYFRKWKPPPMALHKTNSPIIPAPGTTRPCSHCSAPVPTTLHFKTCDACREKSRHYNAKTAAKRKREKEAMISKFQVDAARDSLERAMKALAEDEAKSGEEEEGVGGEGWDQINKRIKREFADAKAKGKVPVKNPESKKRPLSTTPSFDTPTEYQSPDLLYSVLSAHPKTKPLVFSACYSIISSASPPVSLKRRVELVSRALRKELKNNGGGFDRLNPIAQSTTALSSSQTFACLCSHTTTNPNPTNANAKTKTNVNTNSIASTSNNNPTTQSSSSSSTPNSSNPKLNTKRKESNLKRTQSDLSRYFGGISAPTKASSSPSAAATTSASAPITGDNSKPGEGAEGGEKSCGGNIKVIVEDDYSHPFGIKGHRILVEVEH